MVVQFGNGTLRLTTRSTFQLHGVLKQDLKTVFSSVIKNMGSTLGACGDVNRNVLSPPAPFKDRPEYVHAEQLAHDIADLLAPQSGAYYDVWLDGEKFFSMAPEVSSMIVAGRWGSDLGESWEGTSGWLGGQLVMAVPAHRACSGKLPQAMLCCCVYVFEFTVSTAADWAST